MAVTNYASVVNKALASVSTQIIAWGSVPEGNTGQPLSFAHAYADRSIQCEGIFGVGGSGQLEGSNDGINYHVLRDAFGNLLVFTAGAIAQVAELPIFVRPNVTGGDGATSLTFTLALRAER